MNASGLAKLYDRLAPRERVAALVAAGARGDDQEQDRLARSSPWVDVQVLSHQRYSLALHTLADWHVQGQLDLAGQYHRAVALSLDGLLVDETSGRKTVDRSLSKNRTRADAGDSERWRRLAGLLAYLFLLRQQAFEVVVREQGLDAGALLATYPQFEMLQDLAEEAPVAACSPEEFKDWFTKMAAKNGNPGVRPATAEDPALALRDFLAEWMWEDF